MATLRALFPTDQFFSQNINRCCLMVYNTNINNVTNGGRCCLWTVPSGVSWAKFEVWGGGGDGPGACCCMQPVYPGGSGSYARKTIRVVPGDRYRICAGSSGCCAGPCCGTNGFPSWVQTESATYAINLCAQGGQGGCSQCFYAYSAQFSYPTQRCGSYCGADFFLCGNRGGAKATVCGYDSHQWLPGPTYIGGSMRLSFDYCLPCHGCGHVGESVFPGGGGGGAVANGGPCCWGGWGMGGLVVITFR